MIDQNIYDTDFIDDQLIEGLLTRPSEPAQVRDVIAKSMAKQPLSVAETAILVNATQPELIEEIFDAARTLKREVYGNRIVLFAPLYIGNLCINDCAYCGFRRSNKEAIRRTLSMDEIRDQVRALEQTGHKRLILVYGEHARYDANFIAETVRVTYDTRIPKGEIRRVNINAAPLSVEDYKIVKQAGIGTYQVFQETYHKQTYQSVHPAGTRKADYLWRLHALGRAMEAGIDDVGLGGLFGLYDWRFELLSLVTHALHLQAVYGVGPHTISFPRLKPASGVNLDEQWLTSDAEFKRLVAILRLAVPYTGLIMTCRESAEMRQALMEFGVSQIDAGTRLELGGYTEQQDIDSQEKHKEQFMLGDMRPLDEVVQQLLRDGHIPSFCTACYRKGRTGEVFMEYAIPGFIEKMCTPNALSTLQEYLCDFASPETRHVGEQIIEQQLGLMSNESVKQTLQGYLQRIRSSDDRDLAF
ncbi:MAG: [FeFe] hydrogenase H-cluster radical SAM maturase HydG [Armatimonadota bacterium]